MIAHGERLTRRQRPRADRRLRRGGRRQRQLPDPLSRQRRLLLRRQAAGLGGDAALRRPARDLQAAVPASRRRGGRPPATAASTASRRRPARFRPAPRPACSAPSAARWAGLQATEVIKELLGIGESLAGWLLVVDALAGTWRRIRVRRDPECPLCGDIPAFDDLPIHAAHAASEPDRRRCRAAGATRACAPDKLSVIGALRRLRAGALRAGAGDRRRRHRQAGDPVLYRRALRALAAEADGVPAGGALAATAADGRRDRRRPAGARRRRLRGTAGAPASNWACASSPARWGCGSIGLDAADLRADVPIEVAGVVTLLGDASRDGRDADAVGGQLKAGGGSVAGPPPGVSDEGERGTHHGRSQKLFLQE